MSYYNRNFLQFWFFVLYLSKENLMRLWGSFLSGWCVSDFFVNLAEWPWTMSGPLEEDRLVKPIIVLESDTLYIVFYDM